MLRIFVLVLPPSKNSFIFVWRGASLQNVSTHPKNRHDRQQTNRKRKDKMPTLRKIKRGVLPTHLPTQKHHI